MRLVRRALAVVILVACTLAPAGAAGQGEFASTGGTSVSVDAPIVTITVTIDIVLSDPNAEGVGDWANGIAQQIMDYWNDGLAKVSSCPFYDLVVVINPVPPSAAHEIVVNGVSTFVTVPGHHVVAWEGSGPNAPWPETYDAYDADQVVNPGEDSANAYGHELWAVWSGHLGNARDFAHEFGHLLGFGDDYRQNGLPIPGRNGTLMDNGDLIDGVLANRLVDIIKQSGKRLPECWTGTMDLTLSKDYLAEPTGLAPEVCEGSWRVTPTFSVAEDGSVSGTATAELRSGPDCTFEVPGTGSRAEFNVEGTSSQNALELRFVQTSIQPPGDWVGLQGAMATTYLVPRTSPTHAELQTPVDTTDGGPFPVTGEATIALECSTCSPPAS